MKRKHQSIDSYCPSTKKPNVEEYCTTSQMILNILGAKILDLDLFSLMSLLMVTKETYTEMKRFVCLYQNISHGQYDVLKDVLNGKNVFITGPAGSGKSHILKLLSVTLQQMRKWVSLTASTGMAAVNIGGSTIHDFTNLMIYNPNNNKRWNWLPKEKRALIRITQVLIIDEISMITASCFGTIDRILREIKGVSKPFGGVQLVLVGDFLQLPPVFEKDEPQLFAFESSSWREAELREHILEETFRHSDKKLFNILNEVRYGIVSPKTVSLLCQRVVSKETLNAEDCIQLVSHRKTAEKTNQEQLQKLSGTLYQFDSIDSIVRINNDRLRPGLSLEQLIAMSESRSVIKGDENFNSKSRMHMSLKLKKGCKVVVIQNFKTTIEMDGVQTKVLIPNGIQGTVTHCDTDHGHGIVLMSVNFDGKQTEISIPMIDEYYVRYHSTTECTVFTRKQFPLSLGWAVTIHKSQGQTLENVKTGLSQNVIFAEGQAYVAMSRVKTLNGLYLRSFDPDCVKADPKCVAYYKGIENRNSTITETKKKDKVYFYSPRCPYCMKNCAIHKVTTGPNKGRSRWSCSTNMKLECMKTFIWHPPKLVVPSESSCQVCGSNNHNGVCLEKYSFNGIPMIRCSKCYGIGHTKRECVFNI